VRRIYYWPCVKGSVRFRREKGAKFAISTFHEKLDNVKKGGNIETASM
jgi:hypothetical protein